jgi:hypothetical protein
LVTNAPTKYRSLKTHLIFIYSCLKYEHSRVWWQNQTWPQRLPDNVTSQVLTGGGDDCIDDSGVLRLDVGDGYRDLIDKTQALFDWFLDNCEQEWLVKCDDDVWLSDRALKKIASNEHRYSGAFGTDYGGGPLYVLHREVISRLGRLRDYVSDEKLDEDLAVGKAVADVGESFTPLDFNKVHWYDPSKHELAGMHDFDMIFCFTRENHRELMGYAESHYISE